MWVYCLYSFLLHPKPEVGKLRPVGHIGPVCLLNPARRRLTELTKSYHNYDCINLNLFYCVNTAGSWDSATLLRSARKNWRRKKRSADKALNPSIWVFNTEWTSKYFFAEVRSKAVCLICQETVAVYKEYTIKRHFSSKHANYANNQSTQERMTTAQRLIAGLQAQQNTFIQQTAIQKSSTKASYLLAFKLAKTSKPFSKGHKLPWSTLANVTTDGSPNLTGKNAQKDPGQGQRGQSWAGDNFLTLHDPPGSPV